MVDRFSSWITKHPKIVFIVAVLLLVPSAIGYVNTYVNYDILSYLPDSLDSVKGENVLDQTFNQAATAILIVDGMEPKEVVAIKEKVASIDNVAGVTWVDSIVDTSIPQEILPDVLNEIFYSKDGESTLLLVNFKKGSASEETMTAIKDIRGIMNKQCFLSGLSTIGVDTKDLADSQAPIFIAIAIALALFVMSFTMDSWIKPFVLLAALCMAVAYNMGSNVIFGQISYITQCIAAILQLGVTMDYSVFLIDRFDEEMTRTDNRRIAMSKAVSSTFMSLVGSSLTTVFGFLALCFMSLTLGLDIGLVMAKGVLFGIITVVTVLPALILIFYKPIYKLRHKKLVPVFTRLNAFTVKHRAIFAAALLVLIVPAYLLQAKVPVYYNMDKAMPQDLSSIVALNKMRDDFNMATTHFIVMDDGVSDAAKTKLVGEIKQVEGVNNVIALNSFVGAGIPSDIIPDDIMSICRKDGKHLMMINSEFSAATDECNAQIKEINSILKSFDESGLLTGEGVLTSDLMDITSRDFKVTSIISIAAIFVLIAICFKSISVPVLLVSMIEFAILVNKAIPFFTGEVIPFISPTVIGCVQLGATVDYAILMTTRFREELRSGKDKKSALQTAADASCSSIFQSALVFFSATFGVYLFCDISLIKSICLMLATGSVISALVIILMLPPLLYILESFISKTSIGWRVPKIKKAVKKTAKDNANA